MVSAATVKLYGQAVLDRDAANGGEVRVVTLESCAHGVPLEDPQAVADAITAHL